MIKKNDMNKIGIIGFAIILMLGVIAPTMHQVPAGHRGVVLEFGKPISIADEGLFIGMPWWRITVIDMTIQTMKFEDPAVTAASNDLQDVITQVAVNYHLDEKAVLTVYRTLNLEWENRVLRPNVQEAIKAAIAEFTAEDLVQKRPVVKARIQELLIDRVSTFGIVVEGVSITDFKFSSEFTRAIEAKVVAEQRAAEERNKLDIVRAQALQAEELASGKALAAVKEANGTATALLITANAEAEALRLIRAELTPLLVQKEAVEKWDGQLPDLLVTGASENGNMPFIIDVTTLEDEEEEEQSSDGS